MPRVADITGLSSAAAAVAVLLLWLPGLARLRSSRPFLALVVALGAAVVPLGALSAAGYLRGVVGDLSVTTTLLLLRRLVRPIFGWGNIVPRTRLALQASVVAAGLSLYPWTLRSGAVDPYSVGYSNPWFLAGLLVLALAAWSWELDTVALCLALAVLAWALGSGESRNLWDYLLDPPLAFWGLGGLLLRWRNRADVGPPQ
jgi:hypothetical protein